MLTKETAITRIEITEDGIIQYKEVTRIIEDGKIISSSGSNRICIEPGSDLIVSDVRVSKIKNVVHDNQTIKTFLSKKLQKLKDSKIDGLGEEIKKIEDKIKKCEEKLK